MVVLRAFICVRIPRWQRSRTGTVARVMLAHTGEQRNSSSADRLQLHTTAWSFPSYVMRGKHGLHTALNVTFAAANVLERKNMLYRSFEFRRVSPTNRLS